MPIDLDEVLKTHDRKKILTKTYRRQNIRVGAKMLCCQSVDAKTSDAETSALHLQRRH